MHFKIQKTNPIFEIQHQFAETYPFLKLEFFRFPQRKQPLSENVVIKPLDDLKYFDTYYCNWKISITKTRTLQQVETDLELLFGLYVLIYRKAGMQWIASGLMSDYTLQQQNEEGKKQTDKLLYKRKLAA